MTSLPHLGKPFGRRHGHGMMAGLLSVALLSGCTSMPGMSGATSASIASSSVPTRVVTQIINNACNDAKAASPESLTTGSVKGLSKVKDGFGIPYDEHADNYVNPPVPVTDDSYETNKERGIGYAGYEAHLKDTLKDGPESHDDNDIAITYNEPGSPFAGMLTPEEEKYGCCMRWEYSALNANGGISGYLEFLKGNGSGHMQYVAIHSLKTDKWCICCPYDYGPGQNLPTAGGGKYSGGRIGGVTPAVSKILGFQEDGGCPDNALTEWWWVENSDQVKCGEVNDLSEFTKGGTGSPSSSKSSSEASTKGSNSKSGAVASEISTATTAKIITATAMGSSDSDDSNGTESSGGSVSIEPASPNSFVNKMRSEWVHGDLPADKVKYIMMHDTESGTDSAEAIANAWAGNHIAAHFIVDKTGKIIQCVPIDKIAHHAGWAGHSANAKFGVELDGRDDLVGSDTHGEDYGMSSFCIGIEIVHEHNEGTYPEAQLDSLDRLVAYIDKEVGSKPKIIDHKEWASQPDSSNQKQDCSDDFPLQNYKDHRNHLGVSSEEDIEEAKMDGRCPSGEEEEEDSVGGEAIAEMAVKVAGVASPDSQRGSGLLTVEPTDPKWKDYVEQKKKVYGEAGDPSGIWASCCRMSIAVTASGADPDMPVGPCSAQHEYCSGSSKWETVGQLRSGDVCDEVLKPGDFLVWNGPAGASGAHTMVYVGNEAVRKKFPNSDANFVEAGYDSMYPQANRKDTVCYGDFTIFRIKSQGKKKGSSNASDWDDLCFNQGDPRWGSLPYQHGGSIAGTGCGLCATAHTVSICLGREITPPEVDEMMKAYADPRGIAYSIAGTNWGGWVEAVHGTFDDKINIEAIPATSSAIKDALDAGAGGVIITSNAGFGGIKLSNGGFRVTPGGHVMMVYKYDDGFCVKGSAESADGIPASCVRYTSAEFEALLGSSREIMDVVYSFTPKDGSVSKKSGKKSKKSGASYSTSDFSDTFVIGDSILDISSGKGGYGDKLEEHLPGCTHDAECGRYFESDYAGDPNDGMIDIAKREAGKYKRYVVECGINDAGLTPAMANEFISTLKGSGVQIYFVNQRVIGGADDTTCSTIRGVVSESEGIYEIDWNKMATGNESAWFTDNCHPNAAGAEKLTSLIHDVLVEHANGGSSDDGEEGEDEDPVNVEVTRS